MAFLVKFWGTRGSIPTPGQATRKYGGNTTCVEVSVDGTLFICDAGTGVRELGLELLRRGSGPIEGHWLFSHAHWDHIQGFPFFVPAYQPDNTFRVYGVDGDDERFFRLLSGQMGSEYFPVAFSDLGANIVPARIEEGGSVIGGVRVEAFRQTHPGGSYAYSFEKDGRKVVFATDHEFDLDIPDKELPLRDPDALRPVDESFVAFARGCDLLVIDAQYTDAEYRSKVGWGHPRATTTIDVAVHCGARQVALTHHDPMHSDREVEEKVEACRSRAARFAPQLVVFGAREGMELQIR